MGINISVYKIKGVNVIEDESPASSYRYFDKESHPIWDYIRHSGDSDFWMNESLEWETRYEGDDGDDWEGAYHRPKDLDKTIEWVRSNIEEINQGRLISILQEMKTDNSLWFSCSY